jgi:pyruvate/2-oxoglutarate dehydrogenase complex dihydrolipoamide dehydrogenase (E3) component
MPIFEVEVVVVGGGPSGEEASARHTGHGLSVALVEDRLVGGVADGDRRVLIGCTITGSEIVDFLHPATIAVVAEMPLEGLRHAVPPFPTRSELWLSPLEQAGV